MYYFEVTWYTVFEYGGFTIEEMLRFPIALAESDTVYIIKEVGRDCIIDHDLHTNLAGTFWHTIYQVKRYKPSNDLKQEYLDF